jgi:hypothetical protein
VRALTPPWIEGVMVCDILLGGFVLELLTPTSWHLIFWLPLTLRMKLHTKRMMMMVVDVILMTDDIEMLHRCY